MGCFESLYRIQFLSICRAQIDPNSSGFSLVNPRSLCLLWVLLRVLLHQVTRTCGESSFALQLRGREAHTLCLHLHVFVDGLGQAT
jgi:hypothetical protein